MKIEHHFLTTSHDLEALFESTNKISTFCNKLEKQARLDESRYPYNQYVGDGFEFLIELLIKLSPADNRIGIINYIPVKSNSDNGVDGYGTNLSNQKCAIQIKYRTNTNRELTATDDGLDSFITEALLEYDIRPEKEGHIKNHYIFTTAKDLHYYTAQTKFRGAVKTIGYNHLRELLDNNIHFWETCRTVIKNELDLRKIKA